MDIFSPYSQRLLKEQIIIQNLKCVKMTLVIGVPTAPKKLKQHDKFARVHTPLIYNE